jgi:hypothetical protein
MHPQRPWRPGAHPAGRQAKRGKSGQSCGSWTLGEALIVVRAAGLEPARLFRAEEFSYRDGKPLFVCRASISVSGGLHVNHHAWSASVEYRGQAAALMAVDRRWSGRFKEDDQHGALAHEQISRTMQHQDRLLLRALDLDDLIVGRLIASKIASHRLCHSCRAHGISRTSWPSAIYSRPQ